MSRNYTQRKAARERAQSRPVCLIVSALFAGAGGLLMWLAVFAMQSQNMPPMVSLAQVNAYAATVAAVGFIGMACVTISAIFAYAVRA